MDSLRRRLAEGAQTRWLAMGYIRNAIVHNGVLDARVNLLQKPASIEQLSANVRMVLDS